MSTQYSVPSFARLRISPRHIRPLAIVVHSSRMNGFGWRPEFNTRWSCPSSSCREYLEISQNLSFTYVMRPRVSVVATIALWSIAKLTSARSFVRDRRCIDVCRNRDKTNAIAQMRTSAVPRLAMLKAGSGPAGASQPPMRASADNAPAATI